MQSTFAGAMVTIQGSTASVTYASWTRNNRKQKAGADCKSRRQEQKAGADGRSRRQEQTAGADDRRQEQTADGRRQTAEGRRQEQTAGADGKSRGRRLNLKPETWDL